MNATEKVAARVRPAPKVSYRQGRVVRVVSPGYVEVDMGGKVHTVKVPGSLPGVRADVDVRVQVQENTMVVDSITSAIPVPTVIDGSTNTVASSGAYDWTDGSQLAQYARDIATVTRALAADINSLRATNNALVAIVNAQAAALRERGILA